MIRNQEHHAMAIDRAGSRSKQALKELDLQRHVVLPKATEPAGDLYTWEVKG